MFLKGFLSPQCNKRLLDFIIPSQHKAEQKMLDVCAFHICNLTHHIIKALKSGKRSYTCISQPRYILHWNTCNLLYILQAMLNSKYESHINTLILSQSTSNYDSTLLGLNQDKMGLGSSGSSSGLTLFSYPENITSHCL